MLTGALIQRVGLPAHHSVRLLVQTKDLGDLVVDFLDCLPLVLIFILNLEGLFKYESFAEEVDSQGDEKNGPQFAHCIDEDYKYWEVQVVILLGHEMIPHLGHFE